MTVPAKLNQQLCAYWQEFIFAAVSLAFVLSAVMVGSTQYRYDLLVPASALVIFLLLIGQFFWHNRALGLALSVIFAGVSIYMVLAVISEFQDVILTGSAGGMTLLFIGSILFVTALGVSVSMFYKYYHPPTPVKKALAKPKTATKTSSKSKKSQ